MNMEDQPWVGLQHPPLGKSRPRLFTMLSLFLAMEWTKVRNIKGVSYAVLGCGYVDDVGVVVDLLEQFE